MDGGREIFGDMGYGDGMNAMEGGRAVNGICSDCWWWC